MRETLVSVCLSTYRRPFLKETLDSLLAQVLPPEVRLEIVVADNDPEGSGRAIVEEARARAPFPIRYEIEDRRGVAHARNRTLAMAEGEWLAFMDDDETAEPDWIATHYRLAVKLDADLLIGSVEPHFEVDPPDWIIRGGLYELPIGPEGETAKYGYTCNAFVRARLVREADIWFDPVHARSGAEDMDFFLRLGAKPVNNPKAVVRESLSPERIGMPYLLYRARCMGRAQACILFSYSGALDRTLFFLNWVARSIVAGTLAVILFPMNVGRSRYFRIVMVKNVSRIRFVFEGRLSDWWSFYGT